MATIKFFIKDKKDSSTIHVRFWNGRKFDFKRSTPYKVNPKHWNADKQIVRNIVEAKDKDKINRKLKGLSTYINDSYLDDYAKGVIITGNWLEHTINNFFNRVEETDLNLFVKYGEHFIDGLAHRKNTAKGNSLGVAESTVKKYRSVLNKIRRFEKYRKTSIYISDINLDFQKAYIAYLRDVEKLNENTTGRQITFIKTICKDAVVNGIKPHPELEKVKGFSTKADFVYLTEEEIEMIANHNFSSTSYLDNARDWLIVGLFTGQRVSDFLKYNMDLVNNGNIELTQQKTGAKTVIPLHPKVEAIIEKYNGNFPRKISDQRFNEYVKIVCQKAGIVEHVEGSKMDKKTKRKIKGIFPKYELVSSHICRRSFATNHYGKLPTPVIMGITGHATETMFLKYIGKTSKDHAEVLKEFWSNNN